MELKLLRTRQGMSQEDLGIRIGVSQQYISKIEKGNINKVTFGKAKKLAKIFNMCELDFIAMLLNHQCPHICSLWEEDV